MPNITIVNKNDEVIGAVCEKEVYEKKHTHRIVHVLLFNNEGKMMLQMRSKTKSFAPSYWVTSAGGRVDEGETYEEAAYREMKEEIGIREELKEINKHYYNHTTPGLNLFMTVYRADYKNEDLVLCEREVDRVEFFSIDEIKKMIASGEKMTEELKFVIENNF